MNKAAVFYTNENGKDVVNTILYDISRLPDDINESYVLIDTQRVKDTIDSVQKKLGKKPVYLLNANKDSIVIDYQDRPLTQEEKFEQLQKAVDDLILSGGVL